MRSGRNFRFLVYTFQTEQTAIDYVHPFLSFSVQKFCGRTDGQTLFQKVFLFLPDQEYIYMSIPISTIFPILTKVIYLFSYGNGYDKREYKIRDFPYFFFNFPSVQQTVKIQTIWLRLWKICKKLADRCLLAAAMLRLF